MATNYSVRNYICNDPREERPGVLGSRARWRRERPRRSGPAEPGVSFCLSPAVRSFSPFPNGVFVCFPQPRGVMAMPEALAGDSSCSALASGFGGGSGEGTGPAHPPLSLSLLGEQ